ncbi:MAG: LPS export ABC transporter periplasmic protein LptC [Saprospiraceae bacterium]
MAADLKSKIQRGKNIKIVYSDSALVKMIIHSPELERYTGIDDQKDVFPKGVLLEFLDENQAPQSWLKADAAIRDHKLKKVTARGNVIVYNNKFDKLESPELIWDEEKRTITTEKLVRITQTKRGDTLYGFGFESNQSFNKFEIKRKVQGKINVAEFAKVFH